MDGRHAARNVWTPTHVIAMAPWVVVLSGLGVMIVIFLVATGCVSVQSRAIGELPRQPATATPAPGPRPAASAPPVNTGGQLVAAAPPPSGEAILAPAPPSPSPSTMPPAPPTTVPPATSTAPPPAEPEPDWKVLGQYRVMDQYHDAFIAEVLVMNTSRRDRDWTVTLRFPSNVGRLYAAWVDGAPQANLRRSGADYVFTSGVPVDGHSAVPLRFHFERHGRGAEPLHCVVNGAPCVIR
ncbi:hypothetical protein ACN27F_31650 [Solwaraspora sp. WMMB335]|uniref:hypothetical protein n=1 Tax=Solwaraspora sp. WMMB335 TaxID=3404118 RepID=UPI003B93C6A1